MKTLSRYIIYSFIPIFAITLFVFISIIFWGSFIEKSALISKYNLDYKTLLNFILLKMPYFISTIIPFITLISCSILIRNLISTGQWKALLSGGYSPFQIMKPLFYFSILIAFLHFYFNEFITIKNYVKSEEFYDIKIMNRPTNNFELRDISFKSGNYFFYAEIYNLKENKMRNIFIKEITDDFNPDRSFFSSEINWDENSKSWKYKDLKIFTEKGETTSKNIDLNFIPNPKNLSIGEYASNTMDFFSLAERINNLKILGLDYKKEKLDFYLKISNPASNIIMLFLSIIISSSTLFSNKILGSGTTIFVGFLFWNATLTSQRFSQIELITPFWGAFGAHILFTFLIIYLLRKTKAF